MKYATAAGTLFASLRLKWTIEVVAALEGKVVRFGAIQRMVPGITSKMLSTALQRLSQDGLISRRHYPTIPPRVEYELTDRGCRLATVLLQVNDLNTPSTIELELSSTSVTATEPRL